MAPKRTFGFGVALIAGTIASSRGNARAAPAPRRTARRERCRRVMKFAISLSPSLGASRGSLTRGGKAGALRSRLRSIAERHALHDSQHQRAELEVLALRALHNLPDGGHVVILD